MSSSYGNESPRPHAGTPRRPPARFLVAIDADGTRVARLFDASRTQVAEFDAGLEEVVQMTAGVAPVRGAGGAEWDRALAGHSAAERLEADVYELTI